MKVYLRGKKKLKYLTYPQPDVKASNYEDWMSEDSIVMRWLWNLTLLLFLNFVILQRRFGTIAESFSHQSNVTQVYEIYEKLFPTMQSGKPLYEYYSTLKFMGAVITVASYHKFGTTEVIL